MLINLLLAAALLAGPGASTPADVPHLLARLAAADPPIEQVQAAAARRAAATAAEADSWRGRARLAPWLPRLVTSAKFDERSQRVVGLSAGTEVDYLRVAPGRDFSVQLSWNLERLLFSEDEPRAAEAAAQAARRRLDAVEHATRLYFKRRELLAALWLAPPADARERAAAEIAVDEVTAQLDAITGGMFGGRR